LHSIISKVSRWRAAVQRRRVIITQVSTVDRLLLFLS
jgi:hypothetical protein